MDIDREIAEKVMGWKFDNHPISPEWHSRNGRYITSADLWHPSTDIGQAMEVLEKLELKHWSVTKVCEGNYTAFVMDDNKAAHSPFCKTPAMAICKAALAAMEG